MLLRGASRRGKPAGDQRIFHMVQPLRILPARGIMALATDR